MSNPASSSAKKRARESLQEIQNKALELANSDNDLNRVAKAMEIVKNAADARNEFRGPDFRFWATTLTPLITVLIAIVGLIVQAKQYTKSADTQAKQYRESADRQRLADEDTQWRDAMGHLAYDNSGQAMASAMSMQSFFASPRYAVLARSVAASALPQVNNVSGFDTVWFAMLQQTNAENQGNLVDIAQKIAATQWHRWGTLPAADQQKYGTALPFVKTRVNAIDFANPNNKGKLSEGDFAVAAWELDSVSGGLADLWAGKAGSTARPVKPPVDLSNVVFENRSFDGLDFSSVNLEHATLCHASFRGSKFKDAKLNGANIMEDVDLCEVTEVDRSQWKDVQWWRAKCLSPQLKSYLEVHFPQGNSTEKQRVQGTGAKP